MSINNICIWFNIHLLIHLDTSSVMEPGVIECFGSFNIIHPHPGDPAEIDKVSTCVSVACTHRSPLLIHSNLKAFSAVSVVFFEAFLLRAPVIPSRLFALQRDRAAIPLQPTSNGTHRARHPPWRHTSTKLACLACLLIGFFHAILPGNCQLQ